MATRSPMNVDDINIISNLHISNAKERCVAVWLVGIQIQDGNGRGHLFLMVQSPLLLHIYGMHNDDDDDVPVIQQSLKCCPPTLANRSTNCTFHLSKSAFRILFRVNDVAKATQHLPYGSIVAGATIISTISTHSLQSSCVESSTLGGAFDWMLVLPLIDRRHSKSIFKMQFCNINSRWFLLICVIPMENYAPLFTRKRFEW